MTIRSSAALAALLVASFAVTAMPAAAKTIKECRTEWQSQKAAMQAAGTTEKAYIAQCHTPAASASTSAPAAAPKESSTKGGAGNY